MSLIYGQITKYKFIKHKTDHVVQCTYLEVKISPQNVNSSHSKTKKDPKKLTSHFKAYLVSVTSYCFIKWVWFMDKFIRHWSLNWQCSVMSYLEVKIDPKKCKTTSMTVFIPSPYLVSVTVMIKQIFMVTFSRERN